MELAFFGTHMPPPDPDEAYFSHGGAPITGDVRRRVQQSIGLRNAALAMAVAGGGKGRAGTATRMAERGEVDASRHGDGHGVRADESIDAGWGALAANRTNCCGARARPRRGASEGVCRHCRRRAGRQTLRVRKWRRRDEGTLAHGV